MRKALRTLIKDFINFNTVNDLLTEEINKPELAEETLLIKTDCCAGCSADAKRRRNTSKKKDSA